MYKCLFKPHPFCFHWLLVPLFVYCAALIYNQMKDMGLQMLCTKGCALASKNLDPSFKFKMAENVSRHKLCVVEANLFIFLQSFMTLGQRGQEICLFKVSIFRRLL